MSGASSDLPCLLEQDYLRMNDSELVAYEHELTGELVNVTRSANRGVGVGIGLG